MCDYIILHMNMQGTITLTHHKGGRKGGWRKKTHALCPWLEPRIYKLSDRVLGESHQLHDTVIVLDKQAFP